MILELLTEYPATHFSIGSGGYFHHTQINTENFTLFQNQIFSGEKTIHLDGESSVPSLEIQINIGENDIPFYINPSQQKIAKKNRIVIYCISMEKKAEFLFNLNKNTRPLMCICLFIGYLNIMGIMLS